MINKNRLLIFSIVLALFIMTGCNDKSLKAGTVVDGYTVVGDLTLDQVQLPEIGEEIVVITTNKGVIKFRLFEEVAPHAVSGIKELVSRGFYDGLMFSRIIEDLMIRVEVPEEKTEWIEVMGYDFDLEVHDDFRHFTGAVCLANTAGRGTTSSFAILANSGIEKEYFKAMEEMGAPLYPKEILDTYAAFGGSPTSDKNFTIFGHVFYGLDTVMEINRLPLEYYGSTKPIEDIVVEKMEIELYQGKQ